MTVVTAQGVPVVLADITPDWLSAEVPALHGVTEVSAAPVGVGKMSEVFRLVLGYGKDDPTGPSSVIAKVPGQTDQARQIGRATGIWELESRSYGDLLPRTDLRVPYCYYNGAQPDRDAYLLLLEDLGDATIGSQAQGATAEQASKAIRWLAKFHASTWGAADQAEFAWMPHINERGDELKPLLVPAWEDAQIRLGDAVTDYCKRVVTGAIERYDDPALAAGGPDTVIFYDFRLDNMAFPGEDVVVFDWQSVARGPGLYDVAWFLGGNLLVQRRRDEEQGLLRLYQEELARHGVEHYAGADLMSEYRLHMLRATGIAILAGLSVDPSNEEGCAFASMFATRMLSAVEDLQCGDAL